MKESVGIGFVWKPESKDYVMLGKLISTLYHLWYKDPKTAGIDPPSLRILEEGKEIKFSLIKRIEINEKV